MRVENQSFSIMNYISKDGRDELRLIERAGRICYGSSMSSSFDGTKQFVKGLISRGHESVLEHSLLVVKLNTNRAIANELVRHRHAGYSQESTRYANYTKERFGAEITVIDNPYLDSVAHGEWVRAMETCEETYHRMIMEDGYKAEDARGVLPLDLKTTLVMSANYREWRHIFKLRTDKAAHPQMRDLMIALLFKLKGRIPVVFDDLGVEL
jgi:thymidylate synthase (FAD)